jgi:hypothetical protein
MRLYEIDGRYKAFELAVSMPGIGNFRTLIHAESAADAQRAAEHLYGRKRIPTVRRYVPETLFCTLSGARSVSSRFLAMSPNFHN